MSPAIRYQPLAIFVLLLAARSAFAQLFLLPPEGEDMVGAIRYTEATHADTLLDIARRNDLGYEEIRQANPNVDTWLPGEGTRVVLPMRFLLPDAPRKGIVINVAEMRLYYYPKPKPGQAALVQTYPISVGRANWSTPITETRVTAKITDPVWYPTESIRAEHAADGDPLPKSVAAGDDNPLGRFALRLSLADYLIHGTNKAFGIGMQVTHGCIRLYPEDISYLFENVPVGTPVRIVNQPYKTGWHNGQLYLEVHPLLEGAKEENRQNKTPVVQALIAATSNRPQYPVDWHKVEVMALERKGLPEAVGPSIAVAEEASARDNLQGVAPTP
ncbi:MAG: L,D-transpeptidase family protein [Gammaproteobacteria bacterium]|nr:L,D-transpeptidase family protein [Gammaproteobacteria bacterium]